MSRREALDPRTLRYIARRLRKTQREAFASEKLFKGKDTDSRETAQFFRGFACSAMHEADRLIRDARAIERKRKPKGATRG